MKEKPPHQKSLMSKKKKDEKKKTCRRGILHDITGRRQSGKELKEIELKVKTMFDSVSDGILLAQISNRKFFAANKAICEMLGYTEKELLRLGVSNIHPEESVPYVMEQFEELGRKEKVIVYDIPIMKKDGTISFADINCSVITIQGVKYLLGIFRDTTARRQMETELKKREARLKEDQRLASIGSWELDLVKNELFWSEEIYRIFEIDPARFGASYDAFLKTIHPDDRDKVDHTYTSSVRNKTPYDIDHRILMADGRIKHVHEYCETFYDDKGNPLRSIGTVQDITERKLVEEKLQESEKKYRLITEKMTDIVWTTDMALRTTYVSPSIHKVLGFTQEERMGQSVDEKLSPASLSLGLEALAGEFALEGQKNVDSQRNRTLVLEYYHKDGSSRSLETIITGIRNEQGVLIGFHGLSRDITERKQAEDKLRESEEKYRELVKYAPVGIYEVDYEKNLFKSVNDIICEYTGYTREELLNTNIFHLLAEESQKLMSERLGKLLAGKKISDSAEYCIKTKSGKNLWGLLRARYFYKGKKLRGATGIIYNITERKQNEEAMRKREEELSMKSKNLEEMNAALKVLLKEREEDRVTIEESVLANVKTSILPYIEKMKKGLLTKHQTTCLKMLEGQIKGLIAPFLHTISQSSFDLTPQELRVADLVKNGNTTKEIADVLGISTRTVDSHRKNLRIKLGIKNDKTNLRSFLMKFS